MEQTNILERSTSLEELEFVPSETGYGLNVAVVYQDTPTRKWATQVCGHVTQVAGKDAVHSTWWDISRLSDPEVFKDAVLMTMVADVILVSINDAEELPIDLCVWIDAWLPRRYVPMGALIALITKPEQPGDQMNHARDYLRTVAHKGRLDFLLRERRLPVTSRGYFYMEKPAEWADFTTSVVQEALNDEHRNLSIINDR
jgi:hypothetical protein